MIFLCKRKVVFCCILYFKVKAEYTERQKSIAAEVVSIACGYVEPLSLLSDIIAKLDVLTSFAQVSADAPEPYVRPRLLAKGLM